MSYKLENVNNCTKKLSFSFENLDLTEEINTALKEKQKSSNLKGFRKGKAPLAMVQKFFGPQVESDALNRFVQKELSNAVTTEKINLVGYPEFSNMDYKEGKSVSFEAVCEIFPEVELTDYSTLEFTRDTVEASDEDVEKTMLSQLEQKSEMKEISGDIGLINGHHAVFNFEGEKENGEKPENMKGSEFLLEIGSNQFIPGFEEGMLGLKKGEKRVIDTTFPDTYHVEDLKNAKVKFNVELLEIKEKVYPEINDDLSKELGYESAEDFKTKTKEQLLKQKNRAADEKLHQEILDKLIENNSFDVPKTMVTQQEKPVRDELKQSLQSQGFTEEMMTEYFAKWHEDVKSKAEFQVKSGVILDTLARKFEIEVNDSEFEAKLEEMAQGTGLTVDQIKSFYAKDEQTKKNLKYAIREEKTFEKIKENLSVK